jgi:hypothetical protein
MVVATLALALMAYLKVRSGYLWPIAIAFSTPLVQTATFVGILNLGYGHTGQPALPPRAMTIAYCFFAAGCIAFGLVLLFSAPPLTALPIAGFVAFQALMISGFWIPIRAAEPSQ